MDVAHIAELGVFFLFATIALGGALGLILAQRVAHSMLSLIFMPPLISLISSQADLLPITGCIAGFMVWGVGCRV